MLTANLFDKSSPFLKLKKLELCFGLVLLFSANISAYFFQVVDFLGEFYDDISNDIVQREGFAGDTLVKMAGENNFKPICMVRKGDLVDCIDFHGKVCQKKSEFCQRVGSAYIL